MAEIYLIDPEKCFWCEKPLPCGCEHYLEEMAEIEAKKPKPFPAPYIRGFLSAHEADELLNHFLNFNACHLPNPYNDSLLKTLSVSYAADPTHTQCFGGYQDPSKPKNKALVEEEEHCAGLILPSSQAPDCIRSLQRKLNNYLHTMPGYEKHQINYLSVMHYPDENAGIAWHNHNEDFGCDTPVLLISTGAVRDFYLGEINKTNPKSPDVWRKQPMEHGSLIVLPDAMNYTHWHAILKNESKNRKYGVPDISYGPRISINTKCLRSPRVFALTKDPDTGKVPPHPRWGVYVGRKWGQFPDTPYGNYLKTEIEAEFRHYAEKKMLDPAFRVQAIQDLRGKHLLCWCLQDGPNRAPFCHARVWLEIVNRPEGGK